MNGRRLFVALIVAIALVMAACGSSSKSVAPPPAGSTTTTTPVVSTALGTGVTATSIKLGISLVDFKCIQQFIDFTRQNQQAVYQAFIDDVNKKGGINGRKIVADFNTECPLTPTSDLLVQVCTKFTDDDKVFAVMGNLAKDSLTEIWDGPTYVDLRRRIDNAATCPEEEPDLCKSCLKWGHEPFRTSDGKTVWASAAAPIPSGADDELV